MLAALLFVLVPSTEAAQAAPVLSAVGVSFNDLQRSPVGHVVAVFTDTRPGTNRSDYTAVVQWGDGKTTDGGVLKLAARVFGVRGQHQYAAAGRYHVRVTIRTKGRGTETRTRSVADITPSFRGVTDVPLDSTSAIGPTRFIERINYHYAIYDRKGSLLSEGTSGPLAGADPQIVWDPGSHRFYFATLSFPGISWGFSKTGSPNDSSDWCSYYSQFDYGDTANPGYADYPRLGTTKDFVLFGVNRLDLFAGYTGLPKGTDLAWISKPRGHNCPALGSLKSGIFENLTGTDGTLAYTPVPARQVDSSSTGWVLASVDFIHHLFTGDALSLFKVSRDQATGRAMLSSARSIAVAPYRYPDAAPQSGTPQASCVSQSIPHPPGPPCIETLDGRLTQVYSAIDPRFGHIDLWTAHTVNGGAGAEVRWYEINPARASLDQHGAASDPVVSAYNGTIAPDRAVQGRHAKFGSNMVLGFDASSPNMQVTVAMVRKLGGRPQSAFIPVHTSPSTYPGSFFAGDSPGCANTPRFDIWRVRSCYWGDFSGSSPDPTPPDGATGQVWLTNQWADGPSWQTWNWAAVP